MKISLCIARPQLTRRVGVLSLFITGLAGCQQRDVEPPPQPPPSLPDIKLDEPSELANWPWPNAAKSTLHRGVTHWLARSADGTAADLLLFDFNINPHSRLELYSQDEDDAKPFDNVVKFWPLGVGQATRHLNTRLKSKNGGRIIAAWNGPFFGY